MSIPTQSTAFAWKSAAIPKSHAYLIHPIAEFISPPPSRVLDLGCGNGWLTNWLATQGYKVIGVDPSPTGIEISRQTYPKITFFNLEANPNLLQHLGLEAFDLVISTEVVEHCYAPRDWAAACFNCVRPGGNLICSTPYHGYLKNLSLAITGKFDTHFTALWDGGHIKFWSRSTLSKLLIEAGFVDLEFQGAGRIPYLWKSMLIKARKPSEPSI